MLSQKEPTPPNYTLDDFAKYPFLPECFKYLKKQDLPLRLILLDNEYRHLINESYRRIDAAGYGEKYYRGISHITIIDKKIYPTDVLTYVLSLIILKATNLNILQKKFSLNEARSIERLLEYDVNKDINRKNLVLFIASDLFSTDIIQQSNTKYAIKIISYVRAVKELHELEWRMVNRRVSNGFVILTKHEVIRLLRSKIAAYIRRMIQNTHVPHDHVNSDDIDDHEKQTFQSTVLKLQKTHAEKSNFAKKGSKKIEDYPPCIKHAISTLERGDNLSHAGRFLLASYLLNIGLTIQDIIPFFKNAPDFNERVTTYQINNIKNREYNCPSCNKVKTQNLCFATLDCDNIVNPAQFQKGRGYK